MIPYHSAGSFGSEGGASWVNHPRFLPLAALSPMTYFKGVDEAWWRGVIVHERALGLASDGLGMVVFKTCPPSPGWFGSVERASAWGMGGRGHRWLGPK